MTKTSAALLCAPALALSAGLIGAEAAAKPIETIELATEKVERLQAPKRIPDRKLKRLYKETTWNRYVKSVRGGGGTAGVPETDCPPAPQKECLDSWRLKPIWPF